MGQVYPSPRATSQQSVGPPSGNSFSRCVSPLVASWFGPRKWGQSSVFAFGESGFGLQANYTVVDSDASFDPNDFGNQAIMIGLSDSANLVGFYESNLFSVRLAANWRDTFLFATSQLRATNEPVYFDEYLQLDFSAAWNVTDRMTVNFEVLNLTGEDQKQTGRYDSQFLYENDQDPRFLVGLRASF